VERELKKVEYLPFLIFSTVLEISADLNGLRDEG